MRGCATIYRYKSMSHFLCEVRLRTFFDNLFKEGKLNGILHQLRRQAARRFQILHRVRSGYCGERAGNAGGAGKEVHPRSAGGARDTPRLGGCAHGIHRTRPAHTAELHPACTGQLYSPHTGQLYSPDAGRLHSPDAGRLHSPNAGRLHSPNAGRIYSPHTGRIHPQRTAGRRIQL